MKLSIKVYMGDKMEGLLRGEFYKFFRNRKNLFIILVLFIYTIGMIGYNYIRSSQYMEERSRYFNDTGEYSANLSSSFKFRLEENILEGENLEFLERSMEYYSIEARNYHTLAFYYPQDQRKDYKYMNLVMNKIYSSMLDGYEEEIIDLEDIEKRGYTYRELKLLSDYTGYIVDKDIQPVLNHYQIDGANGSKLFFTGVNLIVIFILISLLSADIYLAEISEGSYKLLLTQPSKRKKIYLSKLIVALLTSLGLILGLLLINLLISSLIGGVGNWNYPLMSRTSLNSLSLNGMDKPLLILPLWEFILRGLILLLFLTIFTVTSIFTISILTDSNNKTLGLIIFILSISFGFNAFLDQESLVNLWYPHSYLMMENVLGVANRSNYFLGIIISSGASCISFIISYMKFTKKDFLGAID